MVVIRREVIFDFYFFSEVYDDYGLEYENLGYKDGMLLQLFDLCDWEIIESIVCDGVGFEDFFDQDVECVQSVVLIMDEKYEKFIVDCFIRFEDIVIEKEKNIVEIDVILEMVMSIVY